MRDKDDLRIYYDEQCYIINDPIITEYTNEYVKVSGCSYIHQDIIDKEEFRDCDLYFIPQNFTFFTSYIDLMATFGGNDLPHSPQFESVLYGQEVGLSLPGIDYKIYKSPKYTYAGNTYDIGCQYIDFSSVVNPWHKAKLTKHGASYTDDFISWLESNGYDVGIIESLRHALRVVSITHSDILPALYHGNYRIDQTGNLILFAPFRQCKY